MNTYLAAAFCDNCLCHCRVIVKQGVKVSEAKLLCPKCKCRSTLQPIQVGGATAAIGFYSPEVAETNEDDE